MIQRARFALPGRVQMRSQDFGTNSMLIYSFISKRSDSNRTRRPPLFFVFFFPLPAFTSIHLIATGVSCFLGAGLLSFLIYVYCQRVHKPSQESAIIHPTTPNHLNYKGNTTPKNEKYTPMEFKVCVRETEKERE